MKERFEELLKLQPGSPEADTLRARLRDEIMQVLRKRGLRASMRLVERAGPPGLTLETTTGGYREYVWLSEDKSRKLMISVHATHLFKSTHVLWQQLRTKPLTPREKARYARQETFYAAYNQIAEKAYGLRPPRLSKSDRTILLVGEFEADVNNGGFTQYLDNKGRARARATVAALRRVRAEKTAEMLESAMRLGVTEQELDRLATRFYRRGEDLASLTAVAVIQG
jgi:hypothetical protein